MRSQLTPLRLTSCYILPLTEFCLRQVTREDQVPPSSAQRTSNQQGTDLSLMSISKHRGRFRERTQYVSGLRWGSGMILLFISALSLRPACRQAGRRNSKCQDIGRTQGTN